MNTVRENILLNIEETLRGMKKIDGYSIEFNRVERARVTPVDVEFPCAFIYEEATTVLQEPMGYVTKRLPIILEIGVETGGENISVVLNRVLGDIEKVINIDHTRGGFAIDTTYEKDEIFYLEGEPNMGLARIDINVIFRHLRGDAKRW